MTLLYLLFFVFTILPEISKSASCRRLSREKCLLDEKCTYEADDDVCRCGNSIDFDIYFVLDRSGSISMVDWQLTREFVRDLITFYVSDDSRVGIVLFDNEVTEQLALNGNQDRANVLSVAMNLPLRTGGSTGTRQALGSTADFFEEELDPTGRTRPRLLIMVTDGMPSDGSQVCPIGDNELEDPIRRLANDAAFTIVVRVTSVDDRFNLDCMFEDPLNAIDIPVTDYDRLVDILDTVGNTPCITEPTFQLTEFRLDDNGDNIKFVELYNTGPLVTFDGANVEFDFTGTTIQGGFVGREDAQGEVECWFPNSFLVLYSSDSNPNTMQCVNCDCTMAYGNPFRTPGRDDGDGICVADRCCTNSLYLPIGVNGEDTAGTGAYFTSGSFSNTNFNIQISETREAGRSTLVDTVYDSSFPDVRTGFTFERENLNSVDDPTSSEGTSFIESCYPFSTPGDDYTTCEETTTRPPTTPEPTDEPPTPEPFREPVPAPTDRPTPGDDDCEKKYYECKDRCKYYRNRGWWKRRLGEEEEEEEEEEERGEEREEGREEEERGEERGGRYRSLRRCENRCYREYKRCKGYRRSVWWKY